MDIFQAILLSIIEGITEFLPVSSTGHMIIASQMMNIPQTEFLKTFEISIQLGAICAVFSMYWRTFLLDWEIGRRVLAAFIPTAVIGFILYKLIKHFLLGNFLVVVWALFIGGAILVLFELYFSPKEEPIKELEKITYPQAIIIGLFQTLAVVPGVSRSAATIIGGLLLGIGRKTIVEFSFLLAVPTMLAATVLDLIKTEAYITGEEWGILAVGFLTAFVVAYASVRFLLKYVQKHNFIPFGVYRVLAGVVFLLWFYMHT
jgi:undecaprenyl-diphosphatase